MNSNELLDALKANTGAASDFALARDVLNVHKTSVRDMRLYGLSDAMALQIATRLNLDPAGVLASVHAERAKDPGVKKVWETLAKSIKSAAAAVLIVLGMGITAPEPLQASQDFTRYTLCVVRWLRRAWLALRALAGGFARGFYTITPRGTKYMTKGLYSVPLVLAALAGCGSEAGQNNHGYGYQYGQIGSNGLRVRYDGYPAPTLAQIESLYLETQACTGIKATGPLVIFAHATFGPDATYGQTFLDTGAVLISSLLDPDPIRSFWTYKHEFIHYLLQQSGFDSTANANHQSPLFAGCTQPPAP